MTPDRADELHLEFKRAIVKMGFEFKSLEQTEYAPSLLKLKASIGEGDSLSLNIFSDPTVPLINVVRLLKKPITNFTSFTNLEEVKINYTNSISSKITSHLTSLIIEFLQ